MKGTIESTEPLNEVAWWSSWTRTFKPVEGAYGLVSTEFEEPVFNRIVLLGPPGDPAELVKAASAVFAKEGSRPSFFIPTGDEYSELRRTVREEGFRSLGLFIVMEEKSLAASARGEVGVHEASGDELEAWSRA